MIACSQQSMGVSMPAGLQQTMEYESMPVGPSTLAKSPFASKTNSLKLDDIYTLNQKYSFDQVTPALSDGPANLRASSTIVRSTPRDRARTTPPVAGPVQ